MTTLRLVEIAESCDSCRFYVGTADDDGYCRRYPPRVSKRGSCHPAVGYDGWCGEYLPDDEEVQRLLLDGGVVAVDLLDNRVPDVKHG